LPAPTLARKALGSNSLRAGFPTGASFTPMNERASYYRVAAPAATHVLRNRGKRDSGI
jgi:hypothetical protein